MVKEIALSAKPARAFELCAGHPALDLVNSLDDRFKESGPTELLPDYEALLRFTGECGLLHASQVRALSTAIRPEAGLRAVESARQLREALGATLYGTLEGRDPVSADLHKLERQFRSAAEHRELGWSAHRKGQRGSAGSAGAHWVWGRFATEPELPVWALAESAASLLLSPAAAQVRACGADTCRWLFLDTTKNHSRRWCKMEVCGNRMKARRFQARRE
jgi:predicted RNA-binding Zn ribbon-like protein